jgi:hypothetical protein
MVRADIVFLKICPLHKKFTIFEQTLHFSARLHTCLLFASFSASHPNFLNFHAAGQKRRASVAQASRSVAERRGASRAQKKRRGSVAEASRKRRGASRAFFLQASRKRRGSVAERRGPFLAPFFTLFSPISPFSRILYYAVLVSMILEYSRQFSMILLYSLGFSSIL